jgi:hypothetical protein
MPRINSIIATSLFTKNNFRRKLVKYLETSCSVSFNEERTHHHYFAGENFTLSSSVLVALSDSNKYIGLDIDETDKNMQTMIFVFLIYSLNEFPDDESWTHFLNQTEDYKIDKVKGGIVNTWKNFQGTMMTDRLNDEYAIDDIDVFF